MKITLVISSLSGGGAERVTCNLANYLFRHDCIVDVVTLSNDNDTYKLDNGVQRICLLDKDEKKNKIYNIYMEQKRLKKYIKENQDINCYVAMLPVPSFLMTRFKRYASGKIIVSERVYPVYYSVVNSFLMRYAAKRCDGLVIQTKEIGECYKNIKEKNVIPNAINEDIEFPEKRNIEKKIVAVGRLARQKNYPMIIKAFSNFSVKHPDYILEIYGQGGLEGSLREMVSDYGISDKVKFKGYVKNVSKEISSAACFVMASNYEGISNALIEAMCMGIPCVVVDCDGGGARALVKNNKNGILVRKEAINEMSSGMCRLVEDKVFYSKISNNAVMTRHALSPDIIYEKWLDYIIAITKNGRRSNTQKVH